MSATPSYDISTILNQLMPLVSTVLVMMIVVSL